MPGEFEGPKPMPKEQLMSLLEEALRLEEKDPKSNQLAELMPQIEVQQGFMSSLEWMKIQEEAMRKIHPDTFTPEERAGSASYGEVLKSLEEKEEEGALDENEVSKE